MSTHLNTVFQYLGGSPASAARLPGAFGRRLLVARDLPLLRDCSCELVLRGLGRRWSFDDVLWRFAEGLTERPLATIGDVRCDRLDPV
ncbi:MAG: hypothetical protein JOY89_04895 [Solirubrobacterales bacterium]|nr:hypothetical protein [Solirubrobacterales bacterium]